MFARLHTHTAFVFNSKDKRSTKTKNNNKNKKFNRLLFNFFFCCVANLHHSNQHTYKCKKEKKPKWYRIILK